MSSELPKYVLLHAGNLWQYDGDIVFWYNGEHIFPMTDWDNINAGWTAVAVHATDPNGVTPWIWYRMAFRC